jgi:hypothetical protein
MVSASCARGAASAEMVGNTHGYFVVITLKSRWVAHFCYSRSDFDARYLCAEVLKDLVALRVYNSQFLGASRHCFHLCGTLHGFRRVFRFGCRFLDSLYAQT